MPCGVDGTHVSPVALALPWGSGDEENRAVAWHSCRVMFAEVAPLTDPRFFGIENLFLSVSHLACWRVHPRRPRGLHVLPRAPTLPALPRTTPHYFLSPCPSSQRS